MKDEYGNELKRSLTTHKIIIIDQAFDTKTQELQKELLAKGFAVIITQDVDSLSSVVESASIDLVVVNILLEHVVGFKAIRFLRVKASLRSLPIIAVGKQLSEDLIKAALDLGVDDVLHKNEEYVTKMSQLIDKYLIHHTARRASV